MDDPTDQLAFVLARLQANEIPLTQLAREAGVHVSWLRMLARGRIANPGYLPVKKLFDYFLHRVAA